MKKVVKSFEHAITGITYATKGRNFQIHILVGLLAIVFGIYLQISKTDLMIVILCVGFVLSAEGTNTAIEEVCNKFHPETHPHIALIKDLAAGSVLIAAIVTLVIGIVIFLPYLSR
jgi:diacylglycerol kinase (ATP)